MPIDKKYGAHVMVGSPVKALEGAMLTHMVILKLESFEAAQTYFNLPEITELSKLRKSITDGWATIVPCDADTARIVDSGYFRES